MAHLEQWADRERPGRRDVVLSESGSGLSTTRRHLARLLKMGGEDRVGEVVMTYADRLTRLGQDDVDLFFERCGVQLTILSPAEEKTPEQAVTTDLLSVIASFSGRVEGMGSHTQKDLFPCAETVINTPYPLPFACPTRHKRTRDACLRRRRRGSLLFQVFSGLTSTGWAHEEMDQPTHTEKP